MTEQDYDKLLDSSVDELPREMRPPRDLWIGIDHAIEMRDNDRRSRTQKYFQVAAMLALVIGGSMFFYDQPILDNNNSNEVNLAMLADDIDKGFKVQKANILAVYEGKPALTATWRDQLRELEVARSNVWKELQKNPQNAYMLKILLEVQQQQLDLIENVHTTLHQDI